MIIFSDLFARAVAKEPLVYIDAGARGGLEGPWGEIGDDRLRIVAFEPDETAARALQRHSGPRCDAIAEALWSEKGHVNIHLAATRPASSVHPPAFDLLSHYAKQHGEPRQTEAVVRVPCTTLDEALDRLGCTGDFLKIDTQGSEYEILKGAEQSLSKGVIALVVETWTAEVHRGQGLTGQVMTFLQERGFTFFDLNIAAAWRRCVNDTHPLNGKSQVTGLDLLFFKEPRHWAAASTLAKYAKAAAIAELYGFPDYAAEVLDACEAPDAIVSSLRQDIIAAHTRPPPSSQSLWQRWRSRQKPPSRFAKLHY